MTLLRKCSQGHYLLKRKNGNESDQNEHHMKLWGNIASTYGWKLREVFRNERKNESWNRNRMIPGCTVVTPHRYRSIFLVSPFPFNWSRRVAHQNKKVVTLKEHLKVLLILTMYQTLHAKPLELHKILVRWFFFSTSNQEAEGVDHEAFRGWSPGRRSISQFCFSPRHMKVPCMNVSINNALCREDRCLLYMQTEDGT